ncbi:hypothetical protein BZA77DRAFT_291664 [Pyronema omphalodes]|nr:hypothetical protein BZA77DRAFT_291664 [Pyronema omphalodes]
MTKALISIFEDYVRSVENAFKQASFEAATIQVNRFPDGRGNSPNLLRTQIRTKYNTLQKEYDLFSTFKGYRGVGWNADANTITADPMVWEHIIQAFPRAKKLQTRGLGFFEELDGLFSSSRTTGSFVGTDFGLENYAEGTQLVRNHSVQEEGTMLNAVELSSQSPPLSAGLDPVNIRTTTPTTPVLTDHVGIRKGSDMGTGASCHMTVQRERPTPSGQITKALSELKDAAMKLQWQGARLKGL